MKKPILWLGALGIALASPSARAQSRVLSTDLTNIAAAQNGGRVLGASSTLDNNAAYAASNLIDGQVFNFQTSKGSKGWASNQYDPINMDSVTLGFAGNSLHKLGKIVLNPSVDLTPERWAKDIEVQVSTETAEGPYTPVAQLTLKRDPVPQEFALLPVNARFVRLLFRSNWGSDRAVSLGEVEIYEAIDSSDALGGLITRLESAVTDLKRYQQTQLESSGGYSGSSSPTGAISPTGAPAPTGATSRPATARRGADSNRARVQLAQLVTGSDTSRFPAAGVDIAAAKNGGQIKAYSSTFNSDPEYGPDRLIDGQNFRPADGKGTFGWASQGFAPGKEYVTIGFADDRTRLVGKFVLNPVSNQSDLRWARRVDVQVTSDSFKDGPWRTVASLNVRPEASNQDFVIRPVEAKYVRFVFQANGPGVTLPNADPNINSDRAVSLGEIEVYEAVAGNDQLDALVGRFNQVLVDLKTLRRRGTGAAEGTPATLRRPAPGSGTGKTGATPVKSSVKPAEPRLEETSFKTRGRN